LGFKRRIKRKKCEQMKKTMIIEKKKRRLKAIKGKKSRNSRK